MVDSNTNKLNTDKLIFAPGDQRKLLLATQKYLGVSQKELALHLGISPRTLTTWLSELSAINQGVYLYLPLHIQRKYIPTSTKPQYWYIHAAAIKGGIATYKKYGKVPSSEQVRKLKRESWWNKTGKFTTTITQSLPVTLTKDKHLLAELVGILLGDGGITQYQIVITIDRHSDKQYGKYIKKLLFNVFTITPSIRYRNNAMIFTISRKEAVLALVKLGICIGHKVKNQVSVPQWIIKSKTYKALCLRGLIDTDGSIFEEKHKKTIKNNTEYTYLRLNFTNKSLPLIDFVSQTLRSLEIEYYVKRNGYAVQVENIEEICKYVACVGSNNPKHMQKFKTFTSRGRSG